MFLGYLYEQAKTLILKHNLPALLHAIDLGCEFNPIEKHNLLQLCIAHNFHQAIPHLFRLYPKMELPNPSTISGLSYISNRADLDYTFNPIYFALSNHNGNQHTEAASITAKCLKETPIIRYRTSGSRKTTEISGQQYWELTLTSKINHFSSFLWKVEELTPLMWATKDSNFSLPLIQLLQPENYKTPFLEKIKNNLLGLL